MGQQQKNDVTMRVALAEDVEAVSSILQEAARWVASRGKPSWKVEDLAAEKIRGDVVGGLYWLAMVDGVAAGCVRFQLEDPRFWPEARPGESAFVHRVAVRRAFCGGVVSGAMLDWARSHARSLGRRWLRLDVAAERPTLRAVYERYGFEFHSEKQVGPFLVARYQIGV